MINMSELNRLQAFEHIWRMELTYETKNLHNFRFRQLKAIESTANLKERIINNILEQQLVCANSPAPLW